jgi:NTP pyrophosphatase (non-canonical NTP hydrolase)
MKAVVTQRQARYLDAFIRERARQEDLKTQGKFKHTCADPEPTPCEKLAVLAEEFGEVAKECASEVPSLQQLRDELIQVGATALAWLESLDYTVGDTHLELIDAEEEPKSA